jgi:hypothetical protein
MEKCTGALRWPGKDENTMNTNIINTENGELRVGETCIPATATFDEALDIAPDKDAIPEIDCLTNEKILSRHESWDDWSEEEALKTERRYNQWLDKTIGKERKFAWGRIDARYGRKSANTGIEIYYVNKYLDALFGKNLSENYLQQGESA